MSEHETNHYGENQIQILEGLEAVRKRPGMYIGTTSIKGLHHLISEIVDNSIDEALAGYCKSIKVVLHSDGSCEVIDDGRGVPSWWNPQGGIYPDESLMGCSLRACVDPLLFSRSFDARSHHRSHSLHLQGIGLRLLGRSSSDASLGVIDAS